VRAHPVNGNNNYHLVGEVQWSIIASVIFISWFATNSFY